MELLSAADNSQLPSLSICAAIDTPVLKFRWSLALPLAFANRKGSFWDFREAIYSNLYVFC